MVICSKLYLTLLPPKRGGARRGPPFWDRYRLIGMGPKYLAPPPHKKTTGNARRSPTIVWRLGMGMSIRINSDVHQTYHDANAP